MSLEVGDIPQYCDTDAAQCVPVGGFNISVGGESWKENPEVMTAKLNNKINKNRNLRAMHMCYLQMPTDII